MNPGILVLNFGGPAQESELEPFLASLFDDVLPFPSWLKRLAVPTIARRRAAVVREAYISIGWSPLVEETRAQALALADRLGPDAPPIALGMRYSPPSIRHGVQELMEQGADCIVALSLYPHYSVATTGTVYEAVHDALTELGHADLPVHYAPGFWDHRDYIEALASTVRDGLDALPGEGEVHLLFSPHGLPMSFVHAGDPYPDHVRTSVRAVLELLDWRGDSTIGWQSKVGRSHWITPSTEQAIRQLADQGAGRVLVIPLAFVGEHIETLHEIDVEYRGLAERLGIAHFGRARALGLDPQFIGVLEELVRSALSQFERTSCVRCLLPEPAYYGKGKSCPNCAFEWPRYLARPGAVVARR